MSLVINHNAMAASAARSLSASYGKLNTSVQRLSSGLRINSAADDAAGLAIREMMRADIATTQQGLRNAADAISMIQTADGALGVIDEKLTRMKELAEQAATGTYTTVQRDIINSEYQAMAKEIDRIANATNFNGIKLLDGSVSTQHGGQGIKIHFGAGNNEAEDYYYVNIGDARATSNTGLRVGGDAKNDIWAQGGAAGRYGNAAGCCAAGFPSLNGNAGFASGQSFSYGYNWDLSEERDDFLISGVHLAGRYTVQSGQSLQDLVNAVNAGTQSRVAIQIDDGTLAGALAGTEGGLAICIGDEAYIFGNSAAILGVEGSSTSGRVLAPHKQVTVISSDGPDAFSYYAFASAINNNADSAFWAMDQGGLLFIFAKEGGDNNHLQACEVTGLDEDSKAAAAAVQFARVTTFDVMMDNFNQSGANFSLGGEHWATMTPVQTRSHLGHEVWNVTLNGRDVGRERDLWIANLGDIELPGIEDDESIINGLDGSSFVEVQNADDAPWKGAEVRTQSAAQEALDALTAAIVQKDKIRADLGALQNRLENTMTNLEIQTENLQASESRISDVDVAKEMTEFTKNNVLVQAGVSMLAQANSMSQLALSLMG